MGMHGCASMTMFAYCATLGDGEDRSGHDRHERTHREWTSSSQIWSTSPEVGRNRLEVGQFQPEWAKIATELVNIAQNSPKSQNLDGGFCALARSPSGAGTQCAGGSSSALLRCQTPCRFAYRGPHLGRVSAVSVHFRKILRNDRRSKVIARHATCSPNLDKIDQNWPTFDQVWPPV